MRRKSQTQTQRLGGICGSWETKQKVNKKMGIKARWPKREREREREREN